MPSSPGYHTIPIKQCAVCGEDYQPTNNSQKYCGITCAETKYTANCYKRMHNNPREYLLHLIRRPSRKHLDIDILLQQLKEQDYKCAISNQPLTFTKINGQGRIPTNCSIDQIQAGGGYTYDNIQLVCDIVNRMKIDMSQEDLEWWCEQILFKGATNAIK